MRRAAGTSILGGVDINPHPLTLVLDSKSQGISLDDRVIREVLHGNVWVIDAGNCFDPLRLTRHIRRQSTQIRQVLDHIQVARAFACFQVVALLEKTRQPKGPVFVLRLLTTFTDELVPRYERQRLLRQVDAHLDRLLRTIPVTVTIRNVFPEGDPQLGWLSGLRSRADEVIFPKAEIRPKQAVLFKPEQVQS